MSDLPRRPLSILIVGGAIPWYPPVGGSAIVPFELGQALGRAGHHVDYLVITLDDSQMQSEYVHPLYIPLRRESLTFRNKMLKQIRQYLKVSKTLNRYDVIHCEVEMAALYALHRAVLGSHPRVVAAVYTSGIPLSLWKRRSFLEPCSFAALKLADLVVCPSNYSGHNVSQAYGVPLSKTRAFLGGVPSHFLEHAPHREREDAAFTLVFCGRLNGSRDPVKRLDVLLKAMPQVLERHNVELKVIGAGARLHEYAELARAMAIGERVHFLGHVDQGQLPDHYAAVDLFVLPSRMENFPLVLVEAMACALPVVATKVGGVPEVVEEGVTGLLVPPDDPAALAEAISSLLDDPERMKSMGDRGRERVLDHFTWDKVAERMVGYFEEIL